MPATSSASTRALAGQLRTLEKPELTELLAVRSVRESTIKDFFDLADALLDPESIQLALGRVDRSTLVTLSILAEHSPMARADAAARLEAIGGDPAALDAALSRLSALALISEDSGSLVAYSAVAEQLARWPSLGLPDAQSLASTPAPPALEPVTSVDPRVTDHAAAERALLTTSAIAELLAELDHEPSRELARGGIALPDAKRLAATMNVHIERVPEFNQLAARAGLIALENSRWLTSASAPAWLEGSSAHRWARLAGAWLDTLPRDIRRILAERSRATWGERLHEFVDWVFPAGGEWMRDRVAHYTRDAESLGITAHSTPSRPGAILLSGGADAAGAAMAELFPPHVHRVYLQHDLSVVSPGPLEPQLDARLRTIAEVESRALASSYRISIDSVNRALTLGETEQSIREFLASIALTGIPQPLSYLVSEAANRYGLLRVGALDESATEPGTPEYGARSYIRSVDASLLGTLVVDQRLAPLGLTRTGEHRVVSRFDRGLVFWSLSEARYPVAAEDENEDVVVLTRTKPSKHAGTPAPDPVQSLVERLRLANADDHESTGEAWLARELDQAIRQKSALTVSVALPDGSTIDYQLEPASVAGGRLRARDRGSEIERTLPLSSITGIGPVN